LVDGRHFGVRHGARLAGAVDPAASGMNRSTCSEPTRLVRKPSARALCEALVAFRDSLGVQSLQLGEPGARSSITQRVGRSSSARLHSGVSGGVEIEVARVQFDARQPAIQQLTDALVGRAIVSLFRRRRSSNHRSCSAWQSRPHIARLHLFAFEAT